MKKKFILLALTLLTVLGGVNLNVLNAQETILIGDGQDEAAWLMSNYAPPADVYMQYALSQQIYTADEIANAGGFAGEITQIAFKVAMSSGLPARYWKIYLSNTEQQTLSNFVVVDGNDLVYDNTFSPVSDWNVFVFDRNFDYTGGNLLVTVYDCTGIQSQQDIKWYQYQSPAIAISSGGECNPEDSSIATVGVNASNKNYVKFTIESSGPKPLAVEASADPESVYVGDVATLTATATGGSESYTYSWSPADGLNDAASATPTFTPTAAGNYTFTCTVTDTQGNEASDDVTIYVDERPALDLNVTASKTQIYQGQYTTLTASATGGFSPYTYSWTIGEDEVATSDTYSFTNTEVGTYTITCTVTDANGGTIEKSVDVEVLESAIKPNKQYRIKVMEGTYAGYYLDVQNDDGTIGVETKAERNTQIFTIETVAENQYYLKTADGYYIKCETGSNWWNVHAYNAYDKTPLVFEYTDGEQFYIKDYDKMTGNSQTYSSDPDNCYFKVQEAKVYCDAPIDKYEGESHRTVLWTLEEVAFSAAATADNSNIYDDQTAHLNVTAISGSGNYTYSWSPAEGLDDATSATPTFTPTAAGNYTFTCTVTDTDNNTTVEASVTVNVSTRPELQLTVSADKDLIYNDGEITTLTANVEDGYAPYTYSWTLEENEVGTNETYDFSNTSAGVYTFTCTVTDARNNTQTASATVTVKDVSEKPLEIELGTDSGENENLPSNVYWKYSLTQQIYTKDEINEDKNLVITSVAFKAYHTRTRNLDIYLRNTSETTFNGFYSYAMQTDELHFSGMVTFIDGDWTVITLDTPFEYDASQNILLCVDDNTGSYVGGGSFAVYSSSSNSLYYRNDNYNYSPLDVKGLSFDQYKNHIKFGYKLPAPKLENLIASDYQLYPGESTTISWDEFEGAAKYNIYVNGVSVGNTTELSYELSGLAYNMNPGNKIEVAAVLEDGSESGKASVTVQVAGTFTLTVNVKDNKGNAIEGATVSVTPDNFATDEFGNPIESLENATTDADGKAVFNGVKLLNTNSYCAYSISATMGLYGKHTTTPITNYAGVQNGENYETEIVMTLPAPQNVTADKEYYDEGDKVVLKWELPFRALVGYNVYEYKYGEDNYEKQINDELVQDLTYTIENVKYDMNYAVTAVYDEGESEKENANIQVLGKGTLKVTVTDGVNPIAGATVNVSGYVYPIGEYNETFTTNAEGLVEEYVYVGDYYVTASKPDTHYEATESNNTYVTYDTTSEVEIVLAAKPAATTVTSVTAALNGNNAEVTWTGSAEKYNVYRKNVATSEITPLSQETTETTYTDTDWELLTSGKYQYGVSELAGGGSETLLNESFEEISLPVNSKDKSIWSTTSNRLAIVSTYAHTGSKSVRVQSTGFVAQGGTLCSPAITVGESDPTLSFYYINKNDDNTTGKGEIAVQVYDESLGGAFTIETITAEANDFTLYEKKLEGFSGKTIRIYLDIKNYYYAETIIDDVVVSTAASSVESQIVWSDEIEKKGANTFEGTVSTDWNVAENWSNGVVPAEGDKAIVNANAVISSDVKVSTLDIVGEGSVTVNANATLTVSGKITQEHSHNIVLMEGGQIFQNNDNVTAVFRMDIANPENWNDATAKDGWQFVSSPMSDASIDDFLPITANYDFYKYDGNEENEWRNIKAGGNFESTFQQGAGYLVSFENDEEGAKMYGTLYEGNTYSWSNLLYNSEKPIANWNLVGNPFPFDMQWSKFAENIYNVVDGYAVVNNNGGYDYYTTGDIKVGGAFFVQTTGTGPEMYYSHALRGAKAESDNSVSLIATGKAGKDNVVIKLGGASEGFNKLQNFNDEIATVYVAEAGRRYGIVNLDSDTEEVEVSFDAKMMGSYTISAVPQGKFSSVVLLDRVTGIETDMLAGSYTFTAGSSDNVNRFVLKLSEDTSIDENFVYQSGEELIINAEGTVQIIDVMGRMVYSNDVVGDNNRINVSEFNNAAYIVRVINAEGIKVQKVVVY